MSIADLFYKRAQVQPVAADAPWNEANEAQMNAYNQQGQDRSAESQEMMLKFGDQVASEIAPQVQSGIQKIMQELAKYDGGPNKLSSTWSESALVNWLLDLISSKLGGGNNV